MPKSREEKHSWGDLQDAREKLVKMIDDCLDSGMVMTPRMLGQLTRCLVSLNAQNMALDAEETSNGPIEIKIIEE